MPVPVDAKKQETLLLFIVAVVGIEHLANLPHDIARLHGAGGPHTPSESEGAGFTVFIFPFLIPRYMATVRRGNIQTEQLLVLQIQLHAVRFVDHKVDLKS